MRDSALFVSRLGNAGTGGAAGHSVSRDYHRQVFDGLDWHDFAVPLPEGSTIARRIATLSRLRKAHLGGVTGARLAEFRERLATLSPRIVVLDSALFGPLAAVARQAGYRVVTQTHNCEYDYFAGEAAIRGGLSGTLLNAAYRAERLAVESSDLMFTLSGYDRDRLQRLYLARAPITVVNPHLERLLGLLESDPTFGTGHPDRVVQDLIFLGSDGHQNRLACRQWIDAAAASGARLSIIGRVGQWVASQYSQAELDACGIRLLGFVDSLAATIREADAMVCPMTLGSGIKVKIIDALEHGCPVLASPEGAAGFEFAVDSGYVRIADAPTLRELAAGSLRLATDPGRLLEALRAEVRAQRQTRDASLQSVLAG